VGVFVIRNIMQRPSDTVSPSQRQMRRTHQRPEDSCSTRLAQNFVSVRGASLTPCLERVGRSALLGAFIY
jgi:hypothetical protein